MTTYVLNIGEVKTFNSSVTFTCYGLGSCVGLFMQDRAKGIAGGAHILLPSDEAGPECKDKWYNVRHAIDRILDEFKTLGSGLEGLRAKVTGGASVLGINFNTGSRNTQSVMDELIRRKIYIAALDVGGTLARTAHFISDTGVMMVKTPVCSSYKIF